MDGTGEIFVLTHSPGEHSADFRHLKPRNPRLDASSLMLGHAVDAGIWEGVALPMDQGPASDSDVDDFLRTEVSCPPVVSQRLKQFLEARSAEAQWLPVELVHRDKKQTIAEPHWIANLLATADAIDERGSKLQRNPGDRSQVVSVNRLALVPDRIPATPLFRLVGLPCLVLAQKELVVAARLEGFTGLGFQPLKKLKQSTTPFVPKLMGGR